MVSHSLPILIYCRSASDISTTHDTPILTRPKPCPLLHQCHRLIRGSSWCPCAARRMLTAHYLPNTEVPGNVFYGSRLYPPPFYAWSTNISKNNSLYGIWTRVSPRAEGVLTNPAGHRLTGIYSKLTSLCSGGGYRAHHVGVMSPASPPVLLPASYANPSNRFIHGGHHSIHRNPYRKDLNWHHKLTKQILIIQEK